MSPSLKASGKPKPAPKKAVPKKKAPAAGAKRVSGVVVGKAAPAIKAMASNGEAFTLSSLKGQAVVLYFYPKDDTPGCTVEACEFGASHGSFEKAGAVVLGVSPDGLKSHNRFIQKFQLPFVLLSDEDHAVAKAYGVWVKKSMYGRQYMGIQRSTFLIGKDGKVAKVWPQVSPKGHAAEVLAALKGL